MKKIFFIACLCFFNLFVQAQANKHGVFSENISQSNRNNIVEEIIINPKKNINQNVSASDFVGADSRLCTTVPGTPGAISGPTDICPSFNGDSISLPVSYRIARVANANSYLWTLPAGAFLVSGSTDTSIQIKFSLNFVSGVISVKAVNECGMSVTARTLTVYKRIAATPGSIQNSFFPSIIATSNVCGISSETYRIRKVAYATSYNWSLKTGTHAVISHLNGSGVNDTAVTVSFLPGFSKDSLTVQSQTACSVSIPKIQSLSAVFTPPTPTSISGSLTPCVGNTVVYTVTAPLPTTTQGFISTYRWTKPNNTTIVAATSDSASVSIQYNLGFSGGMIAVKGQTACGIQGSAKSISLLVNPPTPSSITASTGNFMPCIGDTVRYTATAAAPSTSQTAINVFRWTRPAGTSIIGSSPDSAVVDIRFLTGFSGGSISVKGQTSCGVQGAAKSATYIYLPPTPSSISSSTGNYNACVGDVIQYTAVVPAPSATQRPAVVYRWALPPKTTIVGASIDSMTISLRYDANYVGGMLVVKGQTICGATGSAKNQLMIHTGCVAGAKGLSKANQDAEKNKPSNVFPNPSKSQFNFYNKENTVLNTTLFDACGHAVKRIAIQPMSSVVFGDDLNAGVYLLQYQSMDGSMKQIKVIKIR